MSTLFKQHLNTHTHTSCVEARTVHVTYHATSAALNAHHSCCYRAFFAIKYQELFGEGGKLVGALPAEAATYDAFIAAVATVRARTHAPLEGDALSLVPLADMVCERVPTSCRCGMRHGNDTTDWQSRRLAITRRHDTQCGAQHERR
jgi:hypothetical protein